MKDTLKLVASLGLICLFCGAALVYVHNKVEAPCAAAEQKALQENLKLVMPQEAVAMEKMATEGLENVVFFSGKDASGKLIAYAAEAVGTGGFNGNVKVMVGLSLEGKVTGIMVTAHGETPGVGTKATDRKTPKSFWKFICGKKEEAGTPPNKYLDSFIGKNTSNLGSNVPIKSSGVHPISGATYSSNAVYNAVNKVADAFPSIVKR